MYVSTNLLEFCVHTSKSSRSVLNFAFFLIEEENHSLKKGTSISSSTYLGLDKGDGINEEIPNAYSSSDKVSLKNSDSEDNEDENKSGNEDKDHVDNSYKNEYLIPLLVEDMPEEGDPACSPPYPQDIHNQPPDAPVSTQVSIDGLFTTVNILLRGELIRV